MCSKNPWMLKYAEKFINVYLIKRKKGQHETGIMCITPNNRIKSS